MAFEVMFSDKQKDELSLQVYSVVSEAIQKARDDAGMDKMFLNKSLSVSNLTVPLFFIFYHLLN